MVHDVQPFELARSLFSLTKATLSRSAIWINLPGLSFLLLICALAGLVMYANYYDCDPILTKKVTASDQVRSCKDPCFLNPLWNALRILRAHKVTEDMENDASEARVVCLWEAPEVSLRLGVPYREWNSASRFFFVVAATVRHGHSRRISWDTGSLRVWHLQWSVEVSDTKSCPRVRHETLNLCNKTHVRPVL